ncbi:serine/threonine protein kinase, partial [Trichothermofontia sp.]
MESPLPAGSCLRQRYLIQHLLGQGRWGYTYLALDQERFGERCVLRQFHLPKIEKPRRQEEIKLYFQQEVNRLYQLQHPCIPRFWATFMEGRELFIVQEFIPGFSCRQLLLSRRQQQQTFSEAEVLALLKALLPCLDLLHQQDLSQGTLAPDAIVLRISPTSPLVESLDLAIPNAQAVADLTDTQPMLVTFGSFPGGLLRRLCQSEQSTTDLDIRHLRQTLFPIGRMGFMPPEQLHGLEVHPHGDLYALAATCLVLLTGQDPEQLFDQATLTWRWPQEQVSPPLAQVLEHMLAWKPVDRYQSAAAVLAALNLTSPARLSANPPTLVPQPVSPPIPQPLPEAARPTVSAPSPLTPIAPDRTMPPVTPLPHLDTQPPAPLANLPAS